MIRPKKIPRSVKTEIQAIADMYNPGSRMVNTIFVEYVYGLAPTHIRGIVADIGCGKKPYEPLLRPHVKKHIGIEHPDSIHGQTRIDIAATAYATALKSASCDTVLCTAVMEHLEEPLDALVESFRILKPGGYAVYGIPFIWPLHEAPRDFFRYSSFGIKHLFNKAGFNAVQILPLAGYFVTLAQFLTFGLGTFNKGVIRISGIVSAAILFIQFCARMVDRFIPRKEFTWAYLAVAQKPAH